MFDILNPLQHLERYDRPGFITRGSIILCSNAHARTMLLTEETDVAPLLGSIWSQVESMGDGELFTAFPVGPVTLQASICRTAEGYLFLLENPEDTHCLQSLALAAQQLREPLNGTLQAINALEKTLSSCSTCGNQDMRLLRQSYYQLLRIVDNMTHGFALQDGLSLFPEPTELGDFFKEVFDCAASLTESLGYQITFHHPYRDVVARIDRQRVEDCVFQLLSNALQFLPAGGYIHSELLTTATHAILRITDNGDGLAQNIQSSLFTRFRRRPGTGDYRHGLGLGLSIVRSIVTAHGGAVYAGSGAQGGTEIAITLSLNPEKQIDALSPGLMKDEKGAWEKGRILLSRSLPSSVYDSL